MCDECARLQSELDAAIKRTEEAEFRAETFEGAATKALAQRDRLVAALRSILETYPLAHASVEMRDAYRQGAELLARIEKEK